VVRETLRCLGLGDREWRRFLARWLGVAAILIGLAAFQSDGYHHPDEYFQTLEFAGAKLGLTPLEDLPWEYSTRMRSWLQPGMYVVLARVLDVAGVQDPFAWTLVFRLVSGALGWLAVVALSLSAWLFFPSLDVRRTAVAALCLTWFVPYLSVRTSSESLSGSCLILGLVLLVWAAQDGSSVNRGSAQRLAIATSGLLLGLAFELRFAVAVSAVSVVAWALVVARLPWRRAAWLAPGALAALMLGAWVDRWGYGTWVFPPYEYLLQNVVEGVAARRFGATPPFGYLMLAANGPAAILVVPAILTAVVAWVRKPLHPLTWATASLFLAHSLIAHKELRFLFPAASAMPFLCILAVAPCGDRWDAWTGGLWRKRRGIVARVLLALDLLALAIFTLTPTRPQISFQRFVREHYPTRFEAFVTTPDSPWEADRLQMHFYRPDDLVLHQCRYSELAGVARQRFLLVTPALDDGALGLPTHTCMPLYRSFPGWARHLAWAEIDRLPAWDLYRCTRRQRVPPNTSRTRP